MSSASTNAVPKEQVNPDYNAASADIMLLSEEGETFRIHRYYLQAASFFFREMFCLPNDSHQSNDPRSPSSSSREVPSIEIEAPADTLKTLLDMVTGESDQPITSEEGVYALGSVIFLAKKYGFDIAYRFILIRLKSHRNAFPWAVFSVASHIKETSLARSAIPYFISDPNLHVDKVYGGAKGPWRFESPLNKISADYYRQCQPDYFFLLVRAMMRYETMVYECTTPPQNGYDWSDVRRNFGRFEDSVLKNDGF